MYNACGDLKYYSMSRALKSACCLMQEFNMHHGLSHRRCITFFFKSAQAIQFKHKLYVSYTCTIHTQKHHI